MPLSPSSDSFAAARALYSIKAKVAAAMLKLISRSRVTAKSSAVDEDIMESLFPNADEDTVVTVKLVSVLDTKSSSLAGGE